MIFPSEHQAKIQCEPSQNQGKDSGFEKWGTLTLFSHVNICDPSQENQHKIAQVIIEKMMTGFLS
jgi:hypothetical protein